MTHPLPDTVEPWPIDRLIPYGRNARTHSDAQVAQIAASMVEFGWTNPVLADSKGNVIAGHGRLTAAKSLGLTTVPVVILDHLSEAQRHAYILADNKLALNAGWDDETLAAELHALNAEGYDLDLIGFSEEELDALMAPLDDEGDGQGEGDEDEIPEPPADPVTRLGDLWILGRHRLLCGDSTVVTDVDRLLGGAKPHLLVSDPPYGVEYAPEWRNEAGVSATTRTGKVANDDRADWREAWALFPGEVAYVWHAGIHAGVVAESLRACDFEIRSQIIWSKPRFVLSRGHYHWQHEPCWYAVRKTATGHWQGARDQATVWAIGSGGDEDEATVHGTQKPVECMRRPMVNNSAEGDGVYEPFAQVGATEAGCCFIGFVIHHAPGPMLCVQPTVEMAKRASRQRIDPLIDESPSIRERVKPARSRDAGNTMLSKDFPGGTLVLTGANSAVGLRSMPARYLFLDEVDAYPASADEEGDPVGLAEARSLTFAHRRKAFLASTPTIRGMSRIEREYEASDQRRFFVPCPHCGEMQWLKFERLKWDKGQPGSVRYVCEACEQAIAEHHKGAMLAAGEWRATAIASDPGTIGFHISALYSPPGWQSWRDIVRLWEAAQGNDDALRVFKNTMLGETWVESGEAPDWQRLYDRREAWSSGTVPAGGLFLTAGADVQKDRVEIDVWAWGRNLESWLVDHIVIDGGPEHAETWAALERVLGQTWTHASGAALKVARLAIDSGYESSAVYTWGRRMGVGQVSPIKGVEGFNRSSPVSGPTLVDATEGGKKVRRGARLWTVAVSTFKTETYRFLRLERPTNEELAEGVRYPAGTVHLPSWAESEWCKQFVAEQLVTVKNRRGFTKLEWQKLRERNEALDCRVYARAAAWIVGADRWPEAKWRDLEAQLAISELAQTEEPQAGQIRRPQTRRSRRVFHSSYMG